MEENIDLKPFGRPLVSESACSPKNYISHNAQRVALLKKAD